MVTLAMMSVNAVAQQVPSTAEPGTVGERFEQPRVLPAPGAPLVVDDNDLPTPPPEAAGVSFFLERIELDGNSALSDADLAPIIERFTGREIRLSELWDLRAALTVRYRNEGYILSRALVPEQEIEDGTATIVLVEGYVETVEIQGEISGDRSPVDHAIDMITAERPLTAATLERYMLLLNDLAGVSAISVLRASPVVDGASELFIVWEESTISGAVSLDNYGSDEIGPAQIFGTVNLSNLYGKHDFTEFLAAVAVEFDELQYIAVEHGLTISDEGDKLAFDLAYTSTDSDEPASLGALDLEGESLLFTAFVERPLIRSRSQNLTLGGGFKLQNTKSDESGDGFTRDHLRSFVVTGTYDLIDRFRGINLLAVEFSQGLDILGARGSGSNDPAPSRANGETDFTKIAASVLREQYLAPNISLRLALDAQYSLDSLLAAEEFGFGGSNLGRGLDSYAISGDHGLAGSIQLQYGAEPAIDHIDSYELFVFLDQGTVWRKSNVNRSSSETASTIGIGAELNTAFDVFGSVILAMPLDGAENEDEDPGLFFRVTKRF